MNVVNVVPMRHSSIPPRGKSVPHISVMATEVIEHLRPHEGGTFVDVTLGAGGHSALMLEAGAGLVVGFDRDPVALEAGTRRLESFGNRAVVRHASFAQVADRYAELGLKPADGLLADLGVSSMQLDEPARGMSFRAAGPLDMRMDPSQGRTAAELIAESSDDELADILFRLGEERRARRIARCIKQAEAAGKLNNTLELRRAVVRAVGPGLSGGVDPATRTFQGLRIAVNDELRQIDELLKIAPLILKDGGVLAVIAFHSLEDRMLKRVFRASEHYEAASTKPFVPTEVERVENPRSRSAKLRVATFRAANYRADREGGAR